MIRGALLALTLAPACAAAAQEPGEVDTGVGAVLRTLDKINGEAEDVTLRNGARTDLGRLTIRLEECRYPKGSPATDAWALLRISEDGQDDPLFHGWMIASSPALNPLDHTRYDVWVLRCTTS
ncbi:DUF2155 domain-containing protein [Rhodosalinus sp.]|uniref:DUF2155 domain-containing protein n=1 Tax=Rhodosalinus sp. TaxID=2047741 RepID=UPI00356516E5